MEVKRSQVQNFIIFIGDIVGITIGFFLMTYVRFRTDAIHIWSTDPRFIYRWLIIIFVLTLIYLIMNPNDGFFKRKFLNELVSNLKTNLALAGFTATIAYLLNDARDYSRFIYVATLLFSFAWMQISHCVYRGYIMLYRKKSDNSRKMLIITTSRCAREVVKNILKERMWDTWVSGIVIVDKDSVGKQIRTVPVVATEEDMFEYATRSVVDEVFIYLPDRENGQMQTMVEAFEDMGIQVDLNINLFDMDVAINKKLGNVGPYYAVKFQGREISLRMLVLKRLMDIIGGFVGLVVTGIVTLIIGPMIKHESKGPIFFSQERVGRNGRIFKIYKFRSMYADAEERKKELMKQNEMDGLMFKMKDDPRITKVGKFIRKTSIDELPQFWNVLKGDMSLVGTRPPTVDEFVEYQGYHKRRLSMTPGLTGVWQVSGRSDITDFEDVVAMDVDYINHWSLKNDLKIIFKTVKVMFTNDGAR